MKQYLNVLRDAVENGIWVYNDRTKTRCLTALNHQIKFDVGKGEFPLITTRKTNWKSAINEMLCYMRGYTDLKQFHSLGVFTWDANCEAWDSPNKRSKTDCGIIYGASANRVGMNYGHILRMIKDDPSNRGIIWNFWNPDYFNVGCLRPCMYAHQFTVLNGTLHLTSTCRSQDLPLGTCFNLVQAYFLLAITAHLTSLKAGTVTMNLVNCHIYENQLDLVKQQLLREPSDKQPKLLGINTIGFYDVYEGTVTDKLKVIDYEPHPPIKFPFTV